MADQPPPTAPLPGFNPKCRACNSAHRAGIDERLLRGDAARSVSSWLESTHGERIPFQSLLNHKSAHLDVREAAAAIAEQAAPVFQAAVAGVIADVKVLDEVASIAIRTARALEPIVSSGKVSQPVATAFVGALAQARGSVADRHELLHGKKVEVSGVGSPTEDDVEDLHRRAAAALAALPGGADPGAVGGAPPVEPG